MRTRGRLPNEADVAQDMVRELGEPPRIDAVRSGRERPGPRGQAKPVGEAMQRRSQR